MSVVKFWLVFFGLSANSFFAFAEYPGLNLGSEKQVETFSLYNLSILLPLPKQSQIQTWGLDAFGCQNDEQPFLDYELYLKMPAMLIVPYSLREQYAQTRLVSIRFDPEAQETRLVFQPLIAAARADLQENLWAEDAAIHLFFKTDSQQILSWQKKLKTITGKHKKNLLGIHPFFKQNPDTIQRLDFFLCELAKQGPFKATFMNVRGSRVLWSFGGFEIEKNAQKKQHFVKDVTIPNVQTIFLDEEAKRSIQRVVRAEGSLRAGLLPKPSKGDHLMPVFLVGANNHVPNAGAVLRTINRIENPKINTPQTVDCVSCHAADNSRQWLSSFQRASQDQDLYPFVASGLFDATVDANLRMNTANFRAFGYLDNKASVSQRTLNDSIEAQRFFKNSGTFN